MVPTELLNETSLVISHQCSASHNKQVEQTFNGVTNKQHVLTVGGRSPVSHGRNGTKIPVPLYRKIHVICKPEKRSRSSRSSRSSDHPDAMPDHNVIFNPLETPLREAHAKGFLPLGSFAILLTPEGIARIDLSRAGRRIRLNHATFREKVGERVHLCTIGGDGRFHLQGQIQALALPAHTALQRPVQDARQLCHQLVTQCSILLLRWDTDRQGDQTDAPPDGESNVFYCCCCGWTHT